MSPPFFSEACLEKDRLSFFMGAAWPFGRSAAFFIKPSIFNGGFFILPQITQIIFLQYTAIQFILYKSNWLKPVLIA